MYFSERISKHLLLTLCWDNLYVTYQCVNHKVYISRFSRSRTHLHSEDTLIVV